MADKGTQKRKGFWTRTGQSVNYDRPVNQKITLPSALKPAQPPRGSKWDQALSFSNVESPAQEMPSLEGKHTGELHRADININRPANQKITLPSALKPAKPPKGSKWENRHDPSIRNNETE